MKWCWDAPVPSEGERRKARITRHEFGARPHLSTGHLNSTIEVHGNGLVTRPVQADAASLDAKSR